MLTIYPRSYYYGNLILNLCSCFSIFYNKYSLIKKVLLKNELKKKNELTRTLI